MTLPALPRPLRCPVLLSIHQLISSRRLSCGQLAEPGSRVVSGDVVTLDGKAVEWEGPATVRQVGTNILYIDMIYVCIHLPDTLETDQPRGD
jgi:hypothetical protein